MRRRSRLSAVAALLAAITVLGAASAEETNRSRAAHLSAQAFEAMARGDAMREDWQTAYDEGLQVAERAIREDPTYADAYYAAFVCLGRRSERSGKASQAANLSRLKELLDKTLELDPEHAHAWEAKGEMLMKLPWVMGGSTKRGLEALERSAKLAPAWAKPRLRLAEYHLGERDLEKARAEAEEARRLAAAAKDSDVEQQSSALLAKIAARD